MRCSSSLSVTCSLPVAWQIAESARWAISTVVVLESEEPESLFGKVVDRMLLPRALERDLRRTLENLEDIFSMGLPG